MNLYYLIFIEFSLILHSLSFPTNKNENPPTGLTKGEQSDGLFEGDMIFLEPKSRGVGSRPSYQRWQNGTVPYEMTSSISATHQALIIDAMRKMENATQVNGVSCITFRPKVAGDQYFIYVQNGSGCSATVGACWGCSGNRTLNLLHSSTSTCMITGIIQHELLHVLGFYHEQSRPDRDSYVTIVMSNVISGYEHNFNKYNETYVDTLQTPYDYGSVMHYERDAFSVNGNPTIIPIQNATAFIGQRIGMSDIDILEVQRYYGCVPTPNATTTVSTASVTSSQDTNQGSATSDANQLFIHNLTLNILLAVGFIYIHKIFH